MDGWMAALNVHLHIHTRRGTCTRIHAALLPDQQPPTQHSPNPPIHPSHPFINQSSSITSLSPLGDAAAPPQTGWDICARRLSGEVASGSKLTSICSPSLRPISGSPISVERFPISCPSHEKRMRCSTLSEMPLCLSRRDLTSLCFRAPKVTAWQERGRVDTSMDGSVSHRQVTRVPSLF